MRQHPGSAACLFGDVDKRDRIQAFLGDRLARRQGDLLSSFGVIDNLGHLEVELQIVGHGLSESNDRSDRTIKHIVTWYRKLQSFVALRRDVASLAVSGVRTAFRNTFGNQKEFRR
jgi:hypothetical protein